MSTEDPSRPGAGETRNLDQLRSRIDGIDHQLVDLLNQRAALAIEIGKRKLRSGSGVYAPHREAEVLRRIREANHGPLPDQAVEAVFREIMSGSLLLERPPRIGYVGPPGSNAHTAALARFGSSVTYEDVRDVGGVFTEVRRGHVDYGIVPIESSGRGSMAETLDAFNDAAGEVFICSEIVTGVRHDLLADCEPSELRRAYGRPEVFIQCRSWLATQYPTIEHEPVASDADAVTRARRDLERDPGAGSGAIATALAGRVHGLGVLFEHIDDDPDLVERFFVVGRERSRPSHDDKTSVMFATSHRPGALVAVLACFGDRGIQLEHIDKRPRGRRDDRHVFFVELSGHGEDVEVAAALARAAELCEELVVIGSYPRAKRIS